MRDFRDAKAMARSLRIGLAEHVIPITHSQSLELIARVLGCADWHVLSAAIQADSGAPARMPALRPTRMVPLVFMRNVVAFPKQTVPLLVGRRPSTRALAEASKGELEVALILQKRADDEEPGPADVWRVGVVADVLQHITLPDGTVKVMVRARERITIEGFDQAELPRAKIAPAYDEGQDDPVANALVASASEQFRRWLMAIQVPLARQIKEAEHLSRPAWQVQPAELLSRLPEIVHPGALADLIAQYLPAELGEKQRLLETFHVGRRLEMAHALLQRHASAA